MPDIGQELWKRSSPRLDEVLELLAADRRAGG
jgi:hypothetical protein